METVVPHTVFLEAAKGFIMPALAEDGSESAREVLAQTVEKVDQEYTVEVPFAFEPLEDLSVEHSLLAAFMHLRAQSELLDPFYGPSIRDLSTVYACGENPMAEYAEAFSSTLGRLPDFGEIIREVAEAADQDGELLHLLRESRDVLQEGQEAFRELGEYGQGKIGSWSVSAVFVCSLANVWCVVVAGVILVIVAGVIIYRISKRRRRRFR
jgi:hypothetical protein